MFDLFQSLVETGAPVSEVVGVMEAVVMMAIELEGVLEGGQKLVKKEWEWEGEYEAENNMDYEDQDMFPEIGIKIDAKRSKNKNKKGRPSAH